MSESQGLTTQINQAAQKVQKAVPEPIEQKIHDGVKKVGQAIPPEVNRTVQEGAESVKQVAPQVKKDTFSYVKNFRITLLHLILIGYLLGVFLLPLISSLNINNLARLDFWKLEGIRFFSWFLGGIIGWNLLVFDAVAYIYFTHPEGLMASNSRQIFRRKGVWEWLKFLFSVKTNDKPALRSILFLVAWVILAFFAVTSTSSFLGKGVVMGLGLHLLLESWQLQIRKPQLLNSRLFWQIKRIVTLKEQKYYLFLFTGIFALLSILV